MELSPGRAWRDLVRSRVHLSPRPSSVSLGLGARTGPCSFWRPVDSWSGAVPRFSLTAGGPGSRPAQPCFPSPKSCGRFPGLAVAVTVAACCHRLPGACGPERQPCQWLSGGPCVVEGLKGSPISHPGRAGQQHASWLVGKLPWFLAGVNHRPVQSSPQCLPVSATALCASIIILDFLLAASASCCAAQESVTCPGVPRVPSSFSSPRRRRRRR